MLIISHLELEMSCTSFPKEKIKSLAEKLHARISYAVFQLKYI